MKKGTKIDFKTLRKIKRHKKPLKEQEELLELDDEELERLEKEYAEDIPAEMPLDEFFQEYYID